MEANKTVKLDWPFWKKFLLRVFLEFRTPPERKWGRETQLKGMSYICLGFCFLVFCWAIIRNEHRYEDIDLAQPPIVVNGYLKSSTSRGSGTVFYIFNEKKFRQYYVDDGGTSDVSFISWRNDVPTDLMSLLREDNNFRIKRAFSGYITRNKKAIIVTSMYLNDENTPEWNGIEVFNTKKIVDSIRFVQNHPRSKMAVLFDYGFIYFFIGILFILMLINSIFIFFDELKIAKLNR